MQYFPSIFFNGTILFGIPSYPNLVNHFNNNANNTTPITIELSGNPGTGNSIGYTAQINSESVIQSQDLKFIVFVLEDSISYQADNGVNNYNHLVLDILPDQNGVAVDFTNANDLSTTITGSINLDDITRHSSLPALNVDQVSYVGIVQDLSTMEVYQAAKMTHTYLDIAKAENSIVPENFKIENVYPNPFNPTVNISLNIKDNSPISLSIFNMLGHEVAILIENKSFEPGNYTYEWNAGDLPTGTYFFKLNSSGGTSIKKAVFLK